MWCVGCHNRRCSFVRRPACLYKSLRSCLNIVPDCARFVLRDPSHFLASKDAQLTQVPRGPLDGVTSPFHSLAAKRRRKSAGLCKSLVTPTTVLERCTA